MIVGCWFAGLLVSAFGRATKPTSRAHRDVWTTQGVVRGYLTPSPPHYAFLGLPYARPPTRYDRFKAPKPPHRWDGIFEATHRIKCPQPDGEGVENCLVLNVFTPVHAHSLPVLVIVHDGSFQYGWGYFKAPVKFLQESLVIVTSNYRLGALGFLCLGTVDVPGNAGLKDLVAALYWIHKNIAAFGGNPLDVTVYGSGSGAAAVELILLSGLSKGFLHKVILESGTALSPISVSYDPLLTAIDVASMLGYKGTDDVNELSRFFTMVPMEELLNTNLTFLPCIESFTKNALLELDPREISLQQNYHNTPMLIVFTDYYKVNIIQTQLKADYFEYMLPNNLEFDSTELKHKIIELIKDLYIEGEETEGNLYQKYFRDIITNYPVVKSAALHARANIRAVFLMKLTYKFSSTMEENNEGATDNIMNNFFGKYNINEYKDELVLSKLATMWINFVKIGDPTPLTTSLIPLVWQPVLPNEDASINTVNGLLFGEEMKMIDRIASEYIIFWDNLYKKFYRNHKKYNFLSTET